MIHYYKSVKLTYSEIPGKGVLLVHSLTGCMFHCYHCINYDDIINTEQKDYLNIDDIISTINRQNDLFEYLIISGGEYLIAPISEIIEDLEKIRANTNKKIIIYTTGFYLDKLKFLTGKKLVDGYHIDLKLPYHLLNEDDSELIQKTLGKEIPLVLIKQMEEAIEFVIQNDNGYSQIRSVRYPFLNESAFQSNAEWINLLNQKHQKKTPYFVNKFIKID